jgi:hypothetical protein
LAEKERYKGKSAGVDRYGVAGLAAEGCCASKTRAAPLLARKANLGDKIYRTGSSWVD